MAMDLIFSKFPSDKVARHKTRGGLGIDSVEKENRALLAKCFSMFPWRGPPFGTWLSTASMEFIQMDEMQTWLGKSPIEAPGKLYPKSTTRFLVLLS